MSSLENKLHFKLSPAVMGVLGDDLQCNQRNESVVQTQIFGHVDPYVTCLTDCLGFQCPLSKSFQNF
jgi:hypothetical protein